MTIADASAIGVIDTRERILSAAYPLFAHRGIRDVTIDQILKSASVSAETFTLHFESKDELAAAFLHRREREWTIGTIEAGARERGQSPEDILLAIFDVFDEWFARDDFEACTFINVLLEMGTEHTLGTASRRHLVHIRDMVARMADSAGLKDPGAFALSFHILMKGSIISAVEGDVGAARRSQAMAKLLIKEFTPAVRALPVPEVVVAESAGEWLILDDVDFGQPAIAIIRDEGDGTYYYPNNGEFARMGPHPSLDDAFRSFRDDTYPDLW